MYFNDIHIAIYLAIGFLGCLMGLTVGNLNERFANHKEIFSKQAWKEIKINFQPHYMLMTITAIIYISVIYIVGIDMQSWYANIDLITYILLIPMLISAYMIDMKHEIIPNRLVINILELGLISTFANGIFNPNGTSIAFDRITGMFVGSGIFLIITLIGGAIAGKEAMGMGDVKLVGALGLFYGVTGVTALSISSFFMGALVAIIILIIRTIQKSEDKYVAFGPFIVASAILMMFISPNTVFSLFMGLCMGLSNGIMNIFR